MERNHSNKLEHPILCLLLCLVKTTTELLAGKHTSRILGHSFNPVCGFFMMDQVRLCAVWPMENWFGSFFNQIQGWTTVRESYSRALEQGPLDDAASELADGGGDKSWEGAQGTIFAHDFLCVDLGHPVTVCFLPLQSSNRLHQSWGIGIYEKLEGCMTLWNWFLR